MRIRGIHYDVGTESLSGGLTRPTLSPEQMKRDLETIAADLHANAVRISGRDPARIAMAAHAAAAVGLEVWISPMLVNADTDDALATILASADAGARLLSEGHAVVLVIGCELSVFLAGIVPGRDPVARLALLSDPARLVAAVAASGTDPQTAMRSFLAAACHAARERFAGPLTYAAGLWEPVDWSMFDLVGIDAYRDASNASTFASDLAALAAGGRPVVVTEFGCATFRGASALGGRGWTTVDRSSVPPRLKRGTVRDESEQASEIGALLDLFDGAGVDGAFVYTFVAPSYPTDDGDAARDLDAASYALLRSWPDGTTTPKRSFNEVARRYGDLHHGPRAS